MGSLWQGRGLAKQFIHDGYECYEGPPFVSFLAETQIVFTETSIFLDGENGRLLETTQMNAMKSMRRLGHPWSVDRALSLFATTIAESVKWVYSLRILPS